MKNVVATLVVTSLLASPFANAQIPAGVQGPANGNQQVITAGNYSQRTLDETKVALALLQQQKNVAAEDMAYLKEVVGRLASHINDSSDGLIALQLKFLALGQKSQQSPIALAEYLQQVNQIRAKNAILASEIETNTLITRESLPSYDALNVGGTQVSALQAGNVNMAPTMARFTKLRTDLLAQINNTEFGMVITPSNEQVKVPEGNALNASLKGLEVLNAQQIQRLRNDIAEATGITRQTKIYQDKMVGLTSTLIREFVASVGTSEWLRATNENDNLARAEKFKSITNAFYYRSFLRQKSGARIGAIQTSAYDKRKFNIEKFAMQPLKDALGMFRNQAATSEVELQQAFENIRNFVQLYDEKITPVFGKKKTQPKKGDFLSNDTGFLVRANSLFTKATGQTRTAESLLMIMRLALADVREEMMLARGEVLEQKAYHDQRYRSTPELKEAANNKICVIDYDMPAASFAKNCAPKGFKQRALVGDPNNMMILAQGFNGQMKSVEAKRARDARRAQELIDAAAAAGNPGAAEQEADDQFN